MGLLLVKKVNIGKSALTVTDLKLHPTIASYLVKIA
jgi:hypothetical protein